MVGRAQDVLVRQVLEFREVKSLELAHFLNRLVEAMEVDRDAVIELLDRVVTGAVAVNDARTAISLARLGEALSLLFRQVDAIVARDQAAPKGTPDGPKRVRAIGTRRQSAQTD